MLLYEHQNGTKLYKVGLLALVCFAISACSTVHVKYIDRDGIKSAAFAEHKPYYKSGESKPMRLGALHFTKKDAAKDSPGKVFLLQRKRGVYMTETKIGETDNKRYFFSVGVNPRTQDPAIGLRMEF